MTVTDAPPVADVPPPPTPAGRWRAVAAISAALAVVAVAVAAFAFIRDDDDSATIAARDVAAARRAEHACQQWFDSQSGSAGPAESEWCGHMGDWMYEQMASGRRGPMMWGSPGAMHDACVGAMGSYRPRVADPDESCRSMVDWVRDRVGDDDWRGWMMNPSMMGR
jgi:hypothetical protein